MARPGADVGPQPAAGFRVPLGCGNLMPALARFNRSSTFPRRARARGWATRCAAAAAIATGIEAGGLTVCSRQPPYAAESTD